MGTPISVTSFDEVQRLLAEPPSDRATVVAVCNVHSVMTARRQPELSEALRDADITTPDGMPLVWGLRALGHKQLERVFGAELMRRAVVASDSGQRHYLYGSTRRTLAELQEAIRRLNPDIEIVGAVAPPFRELTADEESEAVAEILRSGANVVWVGLGMPKQELWMHRARSSFPGVTVIGVGAAFDFLAGTRRQAPSWMQRSGLEWLYRFLQEPTRLWRRYLWNNPAFLGRLGLQVAKARLLGR